jgi:hypothetical protein
VTEGSELLGAITRRAFAERLALAAAAPFVVIDLPLTLPRGSGPAATPPQQAEPSPLARALTEAIRIRYGDRLSAEDLKTIAQSIAARLEGMERLYHVALTNADEPDFVFAAFRGRE